MPQNYLLNRSFADVDDLTAEAQRWNVDFRQLDCGTFAGELLQFCSNGVHISHARFNRSLRQKGIPPAGMRTVAVPASPDLRLKWRGKTVDGQSLMVFPAGGELSSVSGPDFHIYTCSFSEQLLSLIGEKLQIGDINELGAGIEAFRTESTIMDDLRRCLRSICSFARSRPDAISSAGFSQRVTSDLPGKILTAIAQRQGGCPQVSSQKRQSALQRAEDFIEEHICQAIRVRDICRAAGVSERTLEYAFIERFGIGPNEYLKAMRLVLVRRQLRIADPREMKVVDIANSFGFWHMGQFAADYRQRFDELPSVTLRQSSLLS